jgi:hypothetical protein
VTDRRASGWLSGVVLGFAGGLLVLELGMFGLIFVVAAIALIVWKGPRGLAGAGLVTGVGLVWSVLFARVGLDCTVFLEPGKGCGADNIWGWVAASIVFFVGGLLASALALQRTKS